MDLPKEDKRRIRSEYIRNFFAVDESGSHYAMQHITAPKGSLILWDSRTMHWNQHASQDRIRRDPPRVRMVGYLCYVPKSRLQDQGKALRKEAFEQGVATGHNPAFPEINRTKDHIWPEYVHYLED